MLKIALDGTASLYPNVKPTEIEQCVSGKSQQKSEGIDL